LFWDWSEKRRFGYRSSVVLGQEEVKRTAQNIGVYYNPITK